MGTTCGVRRSIVSCNDCKGTGVAAYMAAASDGGHVVYAGNGYGPGMELPYTNTRGRKAICRVESFELNIDFMRANVPYPVCYYPIRYILFVGKDTVTGASVCRPLWRSITLNKVNELFGQNIVERV